MIRDVSKLATSELMATHAAGMMMLAKAPMSQAERVALNEILVEIKLALNPRAPGSSDTRQQI